MSDVSTGPGPYRQKSVGEDGDAQAEIKHDIDHGLAGAEAKLFGNRSPAEDADSKTFASSDYKNFLQITGLRT